MKLWKWALVASTFMLSAVALADPVSEYEAEAKILLTSIAAKNKKDIQQQSLSLLNLGKKIGTIVAAKHPTCADYLKAAGSVSSKLKSISLEQMEKGYHKDESLPKAPGQCYHPKDLIVHPATVAVMLQQDKQDWAQMELEIQEVLGHLGATRSLL